MPRMRKTFVYPLLAAMVLLGPTLAVAQPWPAPIANLESRGLTIVKRFDAPGGMQGFAARAGTRAVAVYLTPDGKHAIIGTLLDAEGKNVSAPQLEAIIERPDRQKAWPRLEKTQWIPDGKDSADRVLYVFTDPNCGYCHKFFAKTRPWIEAGKVQLRHIPVAILKPSSVGKSAALLTADDPEQALRTHEKHYRTGGITPMKDVPGKLSQQLSDNNQLMARTGIHGTPGIVYKDSKGDVHIKQGVPSGTLFKKMMGPK